MWWVYVQCSLTKDYVRKNEFEYIGMTRKAFLNLIESVVMVTVLHQINSCTHKTASSYC